MRTTDHPGDAALLEALRDALAGPPAEPTPGERAAFHALASQARASAPRPRRAWLARPWWPAPALSFAVLLVVVVLAVATIERVPVTDPIRSVAHSVGVPIESTEVVRARRAMHDVRDALQEGERAELAAATTELRARLAALDPGERGELDDDARDLLHRADDALQPTTGGDHEPGDDEPDGPPEVGPSAPHPDPGDPSEDPAVDPAHPDAPAGHDDAGGVSDEGHSPER